jgi:hypothetical protein
MGGGLGGRASQPERCRPRPLVEGHMGTRCLCLCRRWADQDGASRLRYSPTHEVCSHGACSSMAAAAGVRAEERRSLARGWTAVQPPRRPPRLMMLPRRDARRCRSSPRSVSSPRSRTSVVPAARRSGTSRSDQIEVRSRAPSEWALVCALWSH